MGAVEREGDSRFLCRCSGCCHHIGGGRSVCACACVRACVRVCVCLRMSVDLMKPHLVGACVHLGGCGLLFV